MTISFAGAVMGRPLKIKVAPAQVVLPGAVAGTPEEVPTMSDITRPPEDSGDDPSRVQRSTASGGRERASSDAEAVARLRAEVTDLRLQLADEVRTRRVVVVDETGFGRVRISSNAGESRVDLLGADGFPQIRIAGVPGRGTVTLSSPSADGGTTQVEVFALDGDETDPPYVGVELIDQGDSVAGFVLYEGRPPRTWTEPR
ncbi:MAG TPA: hypothetical protein VEW93_11055 [Acidimicrobiales bacterium]|nr:hypothetical protein [Acidimicrobiales bacterium]